MNINNNRPHLDEGKKYMLFIQTQNNTFDTFDDAQKFAELVTNHIKQIAKKNNYHCVGIVGAAHHSDDIENFVVDKKTQKREYRCNLPDFLGDKKHRVYILLVVSPNCKLKEELYNYFRKKKIKVTERPIENGYSNTIDYVFYQSKHVKSINYFDEELNPWAYDFIRLAIIRHYGIHDDKKERPPFTGYTCDSMRRLCLLEGKKVIFRGYPNIYEYPEEWNDLRKQEPKVVYVKYDLWADFYENEKEAE